MSYLYAHSVTFDGQELNDFSGVTILALNPNTDIKKDLSIYDVARQDANKVTSTFFKNRKILVTVNIVADTRASVESKMDTFVQALSGKEKSLIISQAGDSREYTATIESVDVVKQGGSYLELNLTFACSDYFGYSTTQLPLLTSTNQSSIKKTYTISFGGSAPFQVPEITLDFFSLIDTTEKFVKVGNALTGQTLIISRVWTQDDELVIDCKNKIVTVNGGEVASTGAFPEWKTGTGYLYYEDNFTTRGYDIYAYYNKRYI